MLLLPPPLLLLPAERTRPLLQDEPDALSLSRSASIAPGRLAPRQLRRSGSFCLGATAALHTQLIESFTRTGNDMRRGRKKQAALVLIDRTQDGQRRPSGEHNLSAQSAAFLLSQSGASVQCLVAQRCAKRLAARHVLECAKHRCHFRSLSLPPCILARTRYSA